MIIIVLGPSSCGKGTQADLLAEKYSIPHISTGDLFRKEIADNTELGQKIAPMLAAGHFVPGEITFQILKQHVEAGYAQTGGVIIDGFPRMYSQVEEIQPLIDELLANDKSENSWLRVIHYSLTFDECLRRQENRKATSDVVRSDADEAALRKRYDSYLADIEQIKKYYQDKGVFIEVNAQQGIQEIYDYTTKQIEDSLR
jgi:adenylate kinase